MSSFPPNPWTQQFELLCLTIDGWHECVSNKESLVVVARETYKRIDIAEATISDFMRYLRRNDLAEPLQKRYKIFKNCVQPTKSGLLDVRNFFEELIRKLEARGNLPSVTSRIVRLKELKQRTEEIYSYMFGEPR